MDGATLATLLATGVVAGFLSALFGIGGGIVMVPVLHYVLGHEWTTATALSLMAIAVMTPSAVLQHAKRASVRWDVGGYMACGGVTGVLIGAALEPHVPVAILKVLFAGLMLLAAYRMMAGPALARFHTEHPVMLVVLGAVCGVAAKLFGIGGGLISVPVLALLGMPIHIAIGSSLIPVFTNGALATAAKLAQGADLWVGVALAAGGLAGIPLGARSAHALPAAGLRRVFAGALVAVAGYVALTSGAL